MYSMFFLFLKKTPLGQVNIFEETSLNVAPAPDVLSLDFLYILLNYMRPFVHTQHPTDCPAFTLYVFRPLRS